MPHKVWFPRIFGTTYETPTQVYQIVAYRNFQDWFPGLHARRSRSLEDPQTQWQPPDRQISLHDDGFWWGSCRRAHPRILPWPSCCIHHRGYVICLEVIVYWTYTMHRWTACRGSIQARRSQQTRRWRCASHRWKYVQHLELSQQNQR